MHARKPSDEVAVTGQIAPADLATVKAAGYRAIVCNRPDGEQPDQPTFDEIAAAARALGLEARYQPVLPGHITVADGAQLVALVEELPKPVLAYCRSGARSDSL